MQQSAISGQRLAQAILKMKWGENVFREKLCPICSRPNQHKRGCPYLLAEKLAEKGDRLEHWGGKIVEFLDSFEGSFEEDELAQEGMALQKEGLKLGLKKIYPPEKAEAAAGLE